MFLCNDCNKYKCLCDLAGKWFGPCEACGAETVCVDHLCYKYRQKDEEQNIKSVNYTGVTINCTYTERERIRQDAKKAGLTISSYGRFKMLGVTNAERKKENRKKRYAKKNSESEQSAGVQDLSGKI